MKKRRLSTPIKILLYVVVGAGAIVFAILMIDLVFMFLIAWDGRLED